MNGIGPMPMVEYGYWQPWLIAEKRILCNPGEVYCAT